MMIIKMLDKIKTPDDIKKLSIKELTILAEEIRKLIIETVSKTGGHLASNLGVVELTIAMLKAFSPPIDKIVWDVSHQCYTYKILTGRADRFHTLRQTDGISGFLKRDESPFDVFGAGHAGTALSAALGMAVARDLNNTNEHIVAVVGDGALTCGSSYEALNNIASTTQRLIVVLNDNEMSISENVGSIAHYLGKLLAQPRYNRWKSSVEKFARFKLKLGKLRGLYFRMEEAIKSLFLSNVLFEEFGLRYIGPIDGHNIALLLSAFEVAKSSDEPILLHVVTQKGKGYKYAEEEPDVWHGTGAFECDSGKSVVEAGEVKYSDVFGDVLCRIAGKDDKVIAITAAMKSGTGLTEFANKFPERFFDVGICEEHAVIFAAGLATQGFKPVVAIYSTFMQRAVDYVYHDVCLQRLPVVFCLDRAGIVGDDGPTHHGIYDIAMLRAFPGLIIMQPKDRNELADMLYTALSMAKPCVIRYPKGIAPGASLKNGDFKLIPFGSAEKISLTKGSSVAIWALGDMLPLANAVKEMLASHNILVDIINPRFVVPVDEELLKTQLEYIKVLVTIENGAVTGGFGSAVCECVQKFKYKGVILNFGFPCEIIPHGSKKSLFERYGLTANSIAAKIKSHIS